MVDQVAAADGGELVAVQKAVQPIAGKLGDNHGVHQGRDDSDEGDVQAFVKHKCFSFPSLLSGSKTAVRLTLRRA